MRTVDGGYWCGGCGWELDIALKSRAQLVRSGVSVKLGAWATWADACQKRSFTAQAAATCSDVGHRRRALECHAGAMFRDFIDETVVVGDCALRVRRAGTGPAALLLHGRPRTGSTWHIVAPKLVDAGFSVVVPDSPGYGRSTGPEPTPDHATHSKRAAAGMLAALMSGLGHRRYSVVGHDRGSHVALRFALDHPERVEYKKDKANR